MTTREIRQKYLDFFKSKGHSVISSASLIPENDPTVLFTTAGMHPLVPYLLGEKHPAGTKLVNAQKCIRTGDIEEVGDTTHHTFFEMMGNWSLGNYFKKDSIAYSWEFLTSSEQLGLDMNRIAVSVFEGDEDAPFDEEAYSLWVKIFRENGLPIERIAKLPKKNNWWGPAGTIGPCGPDTEIFYWVGKPEKTPKSFNDDNDLWVEIWNNVFMQYNKNIEGFFEPLVQKNVDTGLGLERVVAILNGFDDNYKIDVFINLINKIEDLSGKKYGEDIETTRAMRIIADHIKAVTFIIGDSRGIAPSNNDQGYVARRLIRRAIVRGEKIGISKSDHTWLSCLASIVASDYIYVYPEIKNNFSFVSSEILKETEKFKRTLEEGLKKAEKLFMNVLSEKNINPIAAKTKNPNQSVNMVNPIIRGKDAFDLYQSYGFPKELIKELAEERGFVLDESGFEEYLEKHQDLSRTASAGKFKGGLADQSEATIKLHTAAHLLLESLRRVLGSHVEQRGSNITAERLRFDFSHPEKMTEEQKKEVEDMVNNVISKDYQVNCEEMAIEEAKKAGATGVFESKYGERVKVYTVGDFSKEICGGPHVDSLKNLGIFKIQKEESSSSGVRRIKAILIPLDNNNK